LRFRRVGLAAVILLQACSKGGSGLAPPGLARYIPSDTLAAAGFDAAGLLKSPVAEKLLLPDTTEGIRTFAEQTGVDPRKDIDYVIFAATRTQPLSLIQGRFDVKAAESKLTGQRFRSENGLWIRDGAAVAFRGNDVAILGPEAPVKAALAEQGMPAAMQAMLKPAAADAQFWVVATGELPAVRAPEWSNLQNLEKALRSVQSLVLWGDLRRGASLNITGNCGKEEDARKLHGGLRALIGMGRLSTPDNQLDLLKLYDAIETKQEGAVVRASASITSAQVDQLLGLWKPRR